MDTGLKQYNSTGNTGAFGTMSLKQSTQYLGTKVFGCSVNVLGYIFFQRTDVKPRKNEYCVVTLRPSNQKWPWPLSEWTTPDRIDPIAKLTCGAGVAPAIELD